ncbi:hypothetical protein AB9F45_39345, partial [Rhizobium leguminosarum]
PGSAIVTGASKRGLKACRTMMTPTPEKTPGLCRDCLAEQKGEARRCISCGSPRLVRHRELYALTLAHIDCDVKKCVPS